MLINVIFNDMAFLHPLLKVALFLENGL